MNPSTRSFIVLLTIASAGAAGQATAQTNQTAIRVPRVTRSFHVGSAHPLGQVFDSVSDANIHVDVDLSYRFGKLTPSGAAWNAKLLIGLNQFTAESFAAIEHPRWINASANLQLVSAPSATGLRAYVQAGPGVYWPKSGPTKPGFNIGVGEQVPLGGVFSLEFGLDLHQVQTRKPVTRFITVQLGVLYR